MQAYILIQSQQIILKKHTYTCLAVGMYKRQHSFRILIAGR